MSLANYSQILVLLLIILVSVIGTSSADVINPGEKNIYLSYQIINIQNYQDYVFVLHGIPNPSLEVLNSSEFSFYKLSSCNVYAVPQNVFNQVQLNQMNDEAISTFLNNDSRVARSNLQLKGLYGSVISSDPLDSALITLKINSIQGNNLDIQKDKIIYTYTSGQTVEEPFQDQNQTPTPTPPGPSWDFYVYYIILPILALIIIFLILLRRRSS